MKQVFFGCLIFLCSAPNLFAGECNLHAYVPISMTRSELPQFNYDRGADYAVKYNEAINKLILNVVQKTGCRLVSLSKERPRNVHEALDAYNNRIENMAAEMSRSRANYALIVTADLFYKEFASQPSGMETFMQLTSLAGAHLNYTGSARSNFSFLTSGPSYKLMKRHLDRALIKLNKKFNKASDEIKLVIKNG